MLRRVYAAPAATARPALAMPAPASRTRPLATLSPMTNVTIRLYAGLKDLVGSRDVEMQLADGATIDQLRARLGEQYPAVQPMLPTLVCAVDEEYVPPEHVLRDGDLVALIPPVSGG